MPRLDVGEALLELEEDRETHEQIENLLAFGTDDPKEVGALVAMMNEPYVKPDPYWLDYLFTIEFTEADLIDDEF